MFVKKKKNRSGSTSVVVAEKIKGSYRELITTGISKDSSEVSFLVEEGKEWIAKEESRRHPCLALFVEERRACEEELPEVHRVLSRASDILLNGADLIFDRVSFDRIGDSMFRKLVKARLSCPASKAATVEFLKNHFGDDVDLSKIYRYLDKLSVRQHELAQDTSVRHTARPSGGDIGVLFYDVATLYFEAGYGDASARAFFPKKGNTAIRG